MQLLCVDVVLDCGLVVGRIIGHMTHITREFTLRHCQAKRELSDGSIEGQREKNVELNAMVSCKDTK